MISTTRIGGQVFHSLFRACVSDQHKPTAAEVDLIASKIWQDGFAAAQGQNWRDVEPGCQVHSRMINAARMALGIDSEAA